MALKAKSSDTDESSDDEDSKMKSYITRQFIKFIKNTNIRGFDNDRKQSSSRTKTEERRMLRKAVSTLFPSDLSVLNVKALDT